MFSHRLKADILPIVAQFPRFDMSVRKLHIGAMTVCYHSMVASEPLLRLAAGIEGPHQAYFTEHEKEERGHEHWMKADIEALGGVIGYPPSQIVTMCGEMYYKVRHIGPEHLLGYMAVIEGFPNPAPVIERMRELYPEASHCLAYHSENDAVHGRDLDRQLDIMDPALRFEVTESAKRTAELYCEAMWNMMFQLGETR